MLLPLFIYQTFKPQTISAISILTLSFFSLFLIYAPLSDLSFSSKFIFLSPMRACLVTLSFWISALIILSSTKVFSSSKAPFSFLACISSLCIILVMAFSLSNLLSFYIIFEASLIPTIFLILGWGYQPERLQARIYLTLYTICARLPLLLGLSFMYTRNGHLSLILPLTFFHLTHISLSSSLWWLMIIFAFIVKIPLYVVHLWLPKAHVEAPVAGSIILAGLLLKLGGYGLLRCSLVAPILSFSLAPIMTRVAIWGGLITRLICIRQTDIKSLIAYSSVGHIAFVVIGTMLCSSWGWQGALTIIIAHGLCSSCIFSLANITYEGTSTRRIFLTKGILSLFPAFSMWWFLLSICNMAAPPSINLFGEISLIISSIWFSPWLIIPIGGCSFLACAYSLILFTSTNHGPFPTFMNPHSSNSSSFFLISALHFIPIWLIISKPEVISWWTDRKSVV